MFSKLVRCRSVLRLLVLSGYLMFILMYPFYWLHLSPTKFALILNVLHVLTISVYSVQPRWNYVWAVFSLPLLLIFSVYSTHIWSLQAALIFLFSLTVGGVGELFFSLRNGSASANVLSLITRDISDIRINTRVVLQRLELFLHHSRIKWLVFFVPILLLALEILLQIRFFYSFYGQAARGAYLGFALEVVLDTSALIAVWIFLIILLRRYILKYVSVLFLSCLLPFAIHLQYQEFARSVKNEPVIFSIKPEAGSAWEEVSLYGRNFGTGQQGEAHVSLNGDRLRVLRWEPKRVIVEINPVTADSGYIELVNVDKKKTNSVYFKYFAP